MRGQLRSSVSKKQPSRCSMVLKENRETNHKHLALRITPRATWKLQRNAGITGRDTSRKPERSAVLFAALPNPFMLPEPVPTYLARSLLMSASLVCLRYQGIDSMFFLFTVPSPRPLYEYGAKTQSLICGNSACLSIRA